jgi:hypothetical protein
MGILSHCRRLDCATATFARAVALSLQEWSSGGDLILSEGTQGGFGTNDPPGRGRSSKGVEREVAHHSPHSERATLCWGTCP